MTALRHPSERNSFRSRLYPAAVIPSGADTTALSSLDSTHQAASWCGSAICGRWNLRGFRNWCSVPEATLVIRLTVLGGVVFVFIWSGTFRRAEADYNGWWMCLIPTKIIKDIGLAIPVFIKWDDAEYAVRAGRKG